MGESLSALYLRDPESAAILRRQAMAQQLARAQNDPIMYRSAASPWVAGLQALAGNLGSMQAERDLGALNERRDGEANEWRRNAMAGLLSGQGAPPAASASPTPPAAPARMGGAAIPAVQRENLPPAQAPADLAPLIEEASRETGIPVPVLTAKIRQESNFRPDAVGRAGEVGLAQIMPATARQPGFGMQGVDPATLRDPRENILFGARYLAARGRAAGVTDWNDPAQVDRALAAYNGGGDPNYVQNVRRWMPQDGAATPASAPGQPAAPQVPGAPPGMTREALIPMIMDGMNSRNPRIREEAQRMAQVAQLLPQPSQRTFTTAAPGSALVDNQGRVVGQVPERPSDAQRDQARWRELSARADSLTPAEREEREMLSRRIAGGNNVSVNVPVNTERTLYGDLAGRAGERLDALQNQASQGAEQIRSGQRIMALLADGAITGTGANFREAFERAAVTAGLVDGRRVANTNQLMAELARGTLDASGQLSGPTSDRDILFLREVAGGNISLTPDAIRRVTQITMDRAGRQIARFNEAAGMMQNDPNVPPLLRNLYRPIEVPADAMPNPAASDRGRGAAPAAPGIPGPNGQGVATPPPSVPPPPPGFRIVR